MKNSLFRILIAAMLVFAAVVSFVLLAGKASSPETYAKTIASIDDKVETVLQLTATSTVASAGISALPGDTATPIAGKLADFTEYFLLILCVLYAEKYLLTIIGAATFRILLPGACLLLAAGILWCADRAHRIGIKLLVLSLACCVIPLSLGLSDMIYNTYEQSISNTITAAEEFSEETAPLSEADSDQSMIQSILSQLSETTTSLMNRAADIVNSFVEALAVMIVTSCVIPILVLLFFIWLLRLATGLDIPLSLRKRRKALPAQVSG